MKEMGSYNVNENRFLLIRLRVLQKLITKVYKDEIYACKNEICK